MAYDIGPKIGIDGEAEFRAQIKAISTNVRTLGTEMEAVTSAFIGQEKSAEALSAKNQVLAKTVSELDSKLELQKKMLADATATYGEADTRTQQWQQAVNKTTAELNKANAQIDANEQALQEDGKTVVDTAEKHEGAMSKIGAASKAGLGAATDALKGLATATAAAVGAATVAVAGLVKESVAGYGEFEQLIGGVETLFGAGGKSLEEYAQSVGKSVGEVEREYIGLNHAQGMVFENAANAFKTAGLSANEYMETVTSSAASLVSSLNGDTEAAAILADLAITDMADNANKMGSSMESIQNAYQGFAKQNYTMLDNLKLGYGGTKEEMQRLLADAEKISGQKFDLSSYADVVEAIHVVQTEMGITGTTAAEASQTIEGSVTAMKTAWQNLVVGLASDNQDIDQLVTNLVDSAATALGNIIPVAETTLGQLGPALQTMLPMVAEVVPGVIETVLPQLVEGGTQLLGALVQGMTASQPAVSAAAAQLVALLISGLEAGLPKIEQEGPGAIKSFTSGVTQALPAILATAASIIVMLIEGLIANEPALVDSAASILGALVSGLSAQLPVLTPVALDAILTLVSSLVGNAGQLTDSAVSLIQGLASGLVSSIPVLAEKAPQIVTGLVKALVENLPKILEAGAEIIGSLVLGIGNNLPQLGTAAGQIIGALGQGVIDLAAQLLQIGGNIVLGVWNGISGKVEWFKEQVAGFFGGVVAGVKEVLGIESPSKVFAGIGENMALGLGNGWDREIDGIRRDIENGVDFSGLDPKVNMPGLTLGVERPNYQDLFAGMVNGFQTAAAGNDFPQSATIILQAGDGMTLARWLLPDLRSAMRDDPDPV